MRSWTRWLSQTQRQCTRLRPPTTEPPSAPSQTLTPCSIVPPTSPFCATPMPRCLAPCLAPLLCLRHVYACSCTCMRIQATNKRRQGCAPVFEMQHPMNEGAVLQVVHARNTGPVEFMALIKVVPHSDVPTKQLPLFVWTIRRQEDGPQQGCWMTDSVQAVPVAFLDVWPTM